MKKIRKPERKLQENFGDPVKIIVTCSYFSTLQQIKNVFTPSLINDP